MKNYSTIKLIVFDLDGTLINSYKTIFKTTLKTLQILNIPGIINENDFYGMMGHHFIDIFRELNIPVNDFDEFIDIYKNHYFDFINESTFYPGLLKTLEKLMKDGIKISLLTTKGQEQADKIINYFELKKFFTYIMGRRDGIADKPSADPLLHICNEVSVLPAETLMVGDTEIDIKCGKNAGTKTCGVLYGYRTGESLSKANPNCLISRIDEILTYPGISTKR